MAVVPLSLLLFLFSLPFPLPRSLALVSDQQPTGNAASIPASAAFEHRFRRLWRRELDHLFDGRANGARSDELPRRLWGRLDLSRVSLASDASLRVSRRRTDARDRVLPVEDRRHSLGLSLSPLSPFLRFVSLHIPPMGASKRLPDIDESEAKDDLRIVQPAADNREDLTPTNSEGENNKKEE